MKTTTLLSVSLGIFFISSSIFATPVWTKFKPDGYGFRFANTFANNAVPELEIRTSGLCGGMAYAALDFYYGKIQVPRQDYRPAPGTTLQNYLYGRQVDSIMANLDRWAEYGFNPDGIRNREFFNWGIGSARISELRSFIDRGEPVVLGLQGASMGSHQVLAIGYDLGRYTGDFGPFVTDFKIFIYDPNHPKEVKTLIPHPSDATFVLAEHPEEGWRSYFVDPNYHFNRPIFLPNPNYPSDRLIRELLFQFYTGADDLRGGADMAIVMIKLKNGMIIPFPNVNLGSRWLNNHEETARLVLPLPVAEADLDSFSVISTFAGGVSGDNWDMAKLVVRGIGGGYDKILKRVPYKHFAGRTELVVPFQSKPPTPTGFVDTVTLDIKTGADDLRGGDANFHAIIHYRSGLMDVFNFVNGTMNWPAYSSHYEYLSLTQRVPADDIVAVTLMMTPSNDIWHMKSIEITAWGPGFKRKIGIFPFFPFSSASSSLRIPTRPM
ncbi:MAG: hypothetical protein A2504_13320 [Bdellovibrionales bacterium RIFOXYD12_FULL_39_22]|nr:MAG: hypothetical protein A2385_01120 [Bdellovibrionales bacterium RIFOXYB1_FULL_39_21]OFZ43607.1 MAG: hypothetical protein A2485_12790 [Bdellovibrionales bacterium RIFOXYC12_FULL_39_17]OFZ44626.1 MAG: hypothetical protein A2404_10480 [Bdellovibrionales bacterium RIFOXYC1_FULL_39_130]OFZ76385.1 MAG: hypothetical protein A2560_07100 [Bdellovibrionales bacterium RIFOXYD1_FULL_39_84]OFZ94651.1 MAG: hypothetical protein A2504_13320 [Bdellovibrionales bacterium RIFOXYD12_FULL_39_22]HLE12892.1 hy